MRAQRPPFPRDFRAGFVGGILRVAFSILLAWYMGEAKNHWEVIKDHPELYDGIYNKTIALGEQLGAKRGLSPFAWVFFTWAPAVLIPAPVNVIFGIGDAVLAAHLSYTTHLLAGYSPKRDRHCSPTSTHEFQLPPGAQESFFEAIARLHDPQEEATAMCNSFLKEWYYSVAVSVGFSVAATWNIMIFFLACRIIYKDAKREQKSFWKAMMHIWLTVLSNLVRLIVSLVLVPIYFVPALLFRFLPISVKSRVRMARQYVFKAGHGVEESGEIQLKELKKRYRSKKEESPTETRRDVTPPTLAGFLSVYDILICLVDNLHYVDLANLGLVSHSVRDIILPSEAYAHRMRHFKMYSCDRKDKSECWSCKMQICITCRFARGLRQTMPDFHLDTCRPYCTKCYYTKVQKPVNASVLQRQTGPRICHHAPPTATSNLFERFRQRPNRHANALAFLPIVERLVCRECSRLTDDELSGKRLERTKWELKAHERQVDGRLVKDRCANCQGALGSGPRWWVCKVCSKECTSTLHGQWTRTKAIKRHADAGGDEAV